MSPFEYYKGKDPTKPENEEDKPRRNHWGQRREKEMPPPEPITFGQIIRDASVQEPEATPEMLIPSLADLRKTHKERNRKKIESDGEPRLDSTNFDVQEIQKELGNMLKAEVIKHVYYTHWTRFFNLATLPILFSVLLLFLGWLFLFVLGSPLTISLYLVMVIINAVSYVWCWIDYRNDKLIVTSHRVIQRDKTMFLREDTTEIRLDKVQFVSLEKAKGILELIFGIGKITITSIGKSKIEFARVQYPEQVRQEIDFLVTNARIESNERRKRRTVDRIEQRLREIYEGKPRPEPVPDFEDSLAPWDAIFPTRKITTHDERGREVYTWHTHPWFLIKRVMWRLVFIIALLLIYIFPLQWFLFPLNIPFLNPALWILLLGIIGFQGFRVWYDYENWVNDRYVIRPDEFITFRKLPFGLDQSTGIIKTMNAQDVQTDKEGFLANFFNYGTVTISSAGIGEPLKFLHVPKPEEVEDIVNDRIEEAKTIREDIEDSRNMEMIYAFFKKNDELKRRRAEEGKPLFGDWQE
jgi:hypothetical protein